MNGIQLDIGFKGDLKPVVSIPLTKSGFIGKRGGLIVFSNEFLFFNENEIICKVLFENLISLKIQPLNELDIFSIKNFDNFVCDSSLLKKVIENKFEVFDIGDSVYFQDIKYSFSIYNDQYFVKLSKVSCFLINLEF